MAFIDFQKHCMDCKKGAPCRKRHVYVLLLKDSITRCKWFVEANPDYIEGMDCLYVGMTGHLPKCRASQHQFCYSGRWKGKKYLCYCDGDIESKACSLTTKGSPKVRNYNTYFLKGKLFKRYNPQINKQSSKEAEKSLAEDLRKKGYGVWYN